MDPKSKLIEESIDLLNDALRTFNNRPWQRRMITFNIERAIQLLENLPKNGTIIERYRSNVPIEALNYDCLLYIFKDFTLQELINLRPVCTFLNAFVTDAVQQLRTLKVFEDESDIFRMSLNYNDFMETFPFLRINDELDDILFVKRNVQSFARFMSVQTQNVTKLVLLTENIKVWNSIRDILHVMPQLTCLVLDNSSTGIFTEEFYNKISDSLQHLTKLEELFFFPRSEKSFLLSNFYIKDGFHFIESMLERLRLLYVYSLDSIPMTKTYENIEELWLSKWTEKTISMDAFPNLQKLSCESIENSATFSESCLKSLTNLKSLHIYECLYLYTDTYGQQLNSFSKLEELTCSFLHIADSSGSSSDLSQENKTINHIQLTEADDVTLEELITTVTKIARVFQCLKILTLHGQFSAMKKHNVRESIPLSIDVIFKKFTSLQYIGRFAGAR